MYDLSSEKSGIRVGNESYQVMSGEAYANQNQKLGKGGSGGKTGTGCCGWNVLCTFESIANIIILL